MPKELIPECVAAAYGVMDGEPLSRSLADELGCLEGEGLLDLVSLANKVRNKFSAGLHVCTILNARSGRCGEDCRFCAQSAHHAATVEEYPLLDVDTIIERARGCYASGVRHFGLVTSGLGFPERDAAFERVLQALDGIRQAVPQLGVCASLGILGEATAAALAGRGIVHYNINLQTNPAKYGELIAKTHAVEDRVRTIRLLNRNGIKVCSGGILGLGESMSDRIELAFALRELDVDVIPLNVLVPIAGTPLENQPRISVADVARSFAIFRLVNPCKTIKFAAGRETVMNDFQGLLMLAGANGYLTGGYLTTRGRDVTADEEFARHLARFSGNER